MQRVLCLIDGFNYYHRLDDYWAETGNNLKWLDYFSLVNQLLQSTPIRKHGQRCDLELASIKFFTAIDKRQDAAKQSRHETYIKALESQEIEVIRGSFNYTPVKCRNCSNEWSKASEKKTDVSIAVKMLEGAFKEEYDVCFLFTGDTDQIPAIQSIRSSFPEKTIVVFQPPDCRFEDKQGKKPGHNLRIKRDFEDMEPRIIHKVLNFNHFKSNQLPDLIEDPVTKLQVYNPYIATSVFTQVVLVPNSP